jgi:hypothetical protein
VATVLGALDRVDSLTYLDVQALQFQNSPMYPVSEAHAQKLLAKLVQLSWMQTCLTTLKFPATAPFCSSSSSQGSSGDTLAKAVEVKRQQVPRFLATLTCLQHLHLTNGRMSAAGSLGLGQALPQLPLLRSLYMQGSALGSPGLTTLAPALRALPALEILVMSHNLIDDDGLAALASAALSPASLATVPGKMSALTHLDVGNNMIGQGGVVQMQGLATYGAADCRGLSALLAAAPSLSRLILKENNIGAEGARALARGLQHTPHLELLSLSDNSLRAEGARALSAALASLPLLGTLDLSDNLIEDVGLVALVPALLSLARLEVLQVGGNALGQESFQALHELLAATDAAGSPTHLPSLNHLCIHHNLILVGAGGGEVPMGEEEEGEEEEEENEARDAFLEEQEQDDMLEEAEWILGAAAPRYLLSQRLEGVRGRRRGAGACVAVKLGEVLERRGVWLVQGADDGCQCGLCLSL